MNTTNAAIIVDWTLFHSNPYTQRFVLEREDSARLILLVNDPESDDYVHPADVTADTFVPKNIVFPMPDIEWDAVIRNTGKLDVVDFKTKALSILKEASNINPVIGLDANHEVNAMYRKSGVLITIEDL